tara:strand:- start:101 stop:622 length:522 start_codon:yes stop_codon:yes gene_type:complete
MARDTTTNQSIYHGAPSVGLRNVGSYQISGEAWISGSTAQAASKVKRFQFPYVTREVTVDNFTLNGKDGDFAGASASTIRVHFVSGSGHDFSTVTHPDGITLVTDSDVYAGLHFYPVSVGSSVTFRAKCKEIYVATTASGSASYRVLADLTNVPTRRMYHLTGSGHADTTGEL